MADPNLLCISGSLRAESFNSKLLQEAARVFGPAEVVFGSLKMPLYDGDLEAAGIPAEVTTLHAQMQAADAIVISTPEYNQNLSGALKNGLDWVSRIKPMPMGGKPVAIMCAAAGRTGGARAQYSLRHCLTPFNPAILQAPEVSVASAYAEFDDTGKLTNERYLEALTNLMAALRAAI